MQEVKFDFDDIKLVPADSSLIRSRKSVNVRSLETRFVDKESLPLMSAPMDSVISPERNGFNPEIVSNLFNAGIRPVVPRHTKVYNKSLGHSFISQSLEEVKHYLVDGVESTDYSFICIDMANGHMAELADTIRKLKVVYPSLVLMVGNIANPYTYKILSEAGADYVRCGIGSGSGCFVDDTLVTTRDGQKKISDIQIGEEVLTHTGKYQPVISRLSYATDESLLEINGVHCTPNHEFYVINRTDEPLVTEDNYKIYAFFIEAKFLTSEHLILSWVD